jgi:hypothetical protein
MVHVAEHHDEGWATIDAKVRRDARTAMPYHLTQTPMLDLVATGSHTPDFNEAMLQGELERQERLKTRLRHGPDTAAWAETGFLFHNYELLQFFDTLALNFHMNHAESRTASTFKNVPRNPGQVFAALRTNAWNTIQPPMRKS